MAHIVEFSPVLADAGAATFHHISGAWNAHAQTERLARRHGHTYHRPAAGAVQDGDAVAALQNADALILAPVTGMRQPADGDEAGRLVGHRILDRVSARRPGLHVILVSHFLVGHGVTHRTSKPHTWGLRALEAHLRVGRNPWTILRPTWLSTRHDESCQIRLTQDPHADGLVSTESIARTVLTAIENPRASVGRTAAIVNLSIPVTGETDLIGQFHRLEPDLEATTPWLELFA